MIRTQLHTPSLGTRFAKHQTVGPEKKKRGSGIPFLIREKGNPREKRLLARRHSHCGDEGKPLEEGGAEAEPAAEDEGVVEERPRGDADLPQVGVDERLRRRRRVPGLRARLHRQVRREPLRHLAAPPVTAADSLARSLRPPTAHARRSPGSGLGSGVRFLLDRGWLGQCGYTQLAGRGGPARPGRFQASWASVRDTWSAHCRGRRCIICMHASLSEFV